MHSVTRISAPRARRGVSPGARGVVFGKAVGDELVFEELAGDVRVSGARNGNGQVAGATLSAPEAHTKRPPALAAGLPNLKAGTRR